MSDGLTIGLSCLLALLITLSALFSAAETAYSSLSPTKLASKTADGKKSAKLINKHYSKFGWTLSTILISNNLVNVSCSALLTWLLSSALGASGMVTIISVFVMTPVIVIFGEIAPKLLAKKYSYGYLSKVCYVIEGLNWLFFPFTFPLSKLTLQSKVTNTESELKQIITMANTEGILEKKEATLAMNALDLDSKTVSSIMTKKVNTIQITSTAAQAMEVFKKTGHSRLPVLDGKRVVGILVLKDLIFKQDHEIKDLLVNAAFVSRNQLVDNALEILRSSTSHLAIVTPSMSSKVMVGILTVEDVVEELIGEIYDEHDGSKMIKQISLHKLHVKGSAKMENLADNLNFTFEDSENMTVKKWVQSRITRTIKQGLTYTYKDTISFKVVKNKNGEETVFEIKQK